MSKVSTVRCTKCGQIAEDNGNGFCQFCGGPVLTASSNKPSLVCHNLTKGEIIALVIFAIIAIISSAYGIWTGCDNLQQIKEIEPDYIAAQEMIESGLYDVPDYLVEEFNYYTTIINYNKVISPILIIVNAATIITAVMVLLRLRFSFKIMVVIYIIGAVFMVVDFIFNLCNGLDISFRGTFVSVAVKISLIKAFVSLSMRADAEAKPKPASTYIIPPVPVAPQPTEPYAPIVPQPVAQSTMLSVKLVSTPVVPAEPVQPQAPLVTSVTPVQQSGTGIWFCSSCGSLNENANFCISCGSKKE